GTDPRQHPTSVRRLLPTPADRDRPTVRNRRPDARGPADLRDHLVWRQQRLLALRAAADTPIEKGSPGRTPVATLASELGTSELDCGSSSRPRFNWISALA